MSAGNSPDVDSIEARVTRILERVPEYIWDGETLPVPVEDIVDSIYGLRVCDVEDLASAPGAPGPEAGHLSGLLLTGPGEIWVNAEEARKWPTRRRFTISHELGHWVLHRTGQQSLFCRAGEIDSAQVAGSGLEAERPVTTRPPVPVTEAEADVFAAAMLMPAHLVQRHHENTEGKLDRLQSVFNCSEKAMRRRVESVVPRDRWREQPG